MLNGEPGRRAVGDATLEALCAVVVALVRAGVDGLLLLPDFSMLILAASSIPPPILVDNGLMREV